MFQFRKGATNNHLAWVMVDATDFATPESALSAATKIKIYGQRVGAAAHAFVSSGTGSLTNDIVHIGASATGQYGIALAKADLSDASAAWYDHYVITLSATGAAYQTLVADGGIWLSQLSDTQSYLSATLSDLQSDFQSRVPKAVATNSQLSDLHSDLRSYLVVMSNVLSDTNSKVVVIEGSQFDYLSAAISDAHSDLRSLTSGVGGGTASAIAAKVWSDYQSKVGQSPSQVYSYLSAAMSDTLSKVTKVEGSQFDVLSNYLSNASNYLSNISALTSDAHSAILLVQSDASNINSMLVAGTFALGASNLSDIESRVWSADKSDYNASSQMGSLLNAAGGGADAATIATKVWSDFESKIGSTTSDMYSALAAGGGGATASAIADKVWSDYQSKVGQTPSQVYSYLSAAVSDALSAAQQTNSRVLVAQSYASDAHSAAILAASHASDAHSAALLAASTASNADSMLQAGTFALGASNLSDIESRVWSADKSDYNASSQMGSLLNAAGGGADAGTIAARVWSDYQSKVGQTPSQVYSYLSAAVSDAASAAQQASSRALVAQSYASDAHSAAALAASHASDVYSAITANRAEPGQGTPAASLDALTKLDYLYKAWRNRSTQTADTYALYNDDATTIDQKATVSDDTTTADRGEITSGP